MFCTIAVDLRHILGLYVFFVYFAFRCVFRHRRRTSRRCRKPSELLASSLGAHRGPPRTHSLQFGRLAGVAFFMVFVGVCRLYMLFEVFQCFRWETYLAFRKIGPARPPCHILYNISYISINVSHLCDRFTNTELIKIKRQI